MCCYIWKCWKCFWHISSKSSGRAICNVMDGGHRFGRWTLQWTTRCFVLYCTGRWAALLMRLLFWVMATLVTSRAWQLATYVWGNVWQCIAMYGATGNWPPMYGAGSGEIRQFFNLLSEGIPIVNQNFWKNELMVDMDIIWMQGFYELRWWWWWGWGPPQWEMGKV